MYIQYITLIASQPGTPDFYSFEFVKFIAAADFNPARIDRCIEFVLCIVSAGRGFGKLLTCETHADVWQIPKIGFWKERVCKWCLDKLHILDAIHAFFALDRRQWKSVGLKTFIVMRVWWNCEIHRSSWWIMMNHAEHIHPSWSVHRSWISSFRISGYLFWICSICFGRFDRVPVQWKIDDMLWISCLIFCLQEIDISIQSCLAFQILLRSRRPPAGQPRENESAKSANHCILEVRTPIAIAKATWGKNWMTW